MQASKRGVQSLHPNGNGENTSLVSSSSASSSVSSVLASSDGPTDLDSRVAKKSKHIVDPTIPKALPSLPPELLSHIFQYEKKHLPLRLVCKKFDESIQHLHQSHDYDCKECRCSTEMNELFIKRMRLHWLSKWGLLGSNASGCSPLLSFSSHLMKLDDSSLLNSISSLQQSRIKDIQVHLIPGEIGTVTHAEFLGSPEVASSLEACTIMPYTPGNEISLLPFQIVSSLTKATNLKVLTLSNWRLELSATLTHVLRMFRSLSRLETLDLKNCRITDGFLNALVDYPCLENLISLDLSSNFIHDASIFLASPLLRNLKHLSLGRNNLTDHIQKIVKSMALPSLESLDLSQCRTTDDDIKAIRMAPALSTLKKLNISHNRIGSDSLFDFFASLSAGSKTCTFASSLESLVFGADSVPRIRPEFAARFSPDAIAALKPSKIQSLHIQIPENGRDTAFALAALPVFGSVKELIISDPEDEGIHSIFCPVTSSFTSLRSLCISCTFTPITWRGMQFLAASSLAKGLRRIQIDSDIMHSPSEHMSDKCIQALASSSNLSNLREIVLTADHHVSVSVGIMSLLASSSLPSLTRLDLNGGYEDEPADAAASVKEVVDKICSYLESVKTVLFTQSPFSLRVQETLEESGYGHLWNTI